MGASKRPLPRTNLPRRVPPYPPGMVVSPLHLLFDHRLPSWHANIDNKNMLRIAFRQISAPVVTRLLRLLWRAARFLSAHSLGRSVLRNVLRPPVLHYVRPSRARSGEGDLYPSYLRLQDPQVGFTVVVFLGGGGGVGCKHGISIALLPRGYREARLFQC